MAISRANSIKCLLEGKWIDRKIYKNCGPYSLHTKVRGRPPVKVLIGIEKDFITILQVSFIKVKEALMEGRRGWGLEGTF